MCKKINVILDTDTYNECDDQFALAYLIKSQEIFNIDAITIAPYSHNSKRKITVFDSQQLSYNEVLKISMWLKFNTENTVYKGSTDYLSNGYFESNDAVNKIIEVALKNNKTYILAIGAITNIAIAILKEPRIVDKIEIIWLGGNEIKFKDNSEYNFRQDVKAVKEVLYSGVKLTILPCKNVVSNLMIDLETISSKIGNQSEICDYLINKFHDDGYHGITNSRIIWDIAVVAYAKNKDWFEVKEISCPIINEDNTYEMTQNHNIVNFVTNLNKDAIYNDLFNKLKD